MLGRVTLASRNIQSAAWTGAGARFVAVLLKGILEGRGPPGRDGAAAAVAVLGVRYAADTEHSGAERWHAGGDEGPGGADAGPEAVRPNVFRGPKRLAGHQQIRFSFHLCPGGSPVQSTQSASLARQRQPSAARRGAGGQRRGVAAELRRNAGDAAPANCIGCWRRSPCPSCGSMRSFRRTARSLQRCCSPS